MSDVLVISCGREIRNEQGRPRAELDFDRVLANRLLIAGLRYEGLISCLELNNRGLRIAFREESQAVDRPALALLVRTYPWCKVLT